MTRQTPYSLLPDNAYWRRSVAGLPAEEVDPVPNLPRFSVGPADKVMTAGSCFAQHIARYMRQSGFNAMITETAHPMISAENAALYNYGTFTARYGNIYVVRQLLQLFRRAYGQFQPAEDVWVEADGSLLDPFRPQIQPGGFATKREYDIDREQHFAAVRRGFEELDVFVFTLGLTEGWVSKEDGAVFPLCPGTVGGQFDPGRHAFHNFSVSETVSDMTQFVALLHGVNPKARIILTVSPVPLIATASGKHVLSATTYSKSVLRVACEMLEQSLPRVMYFPSYEVILGPHARGSYLAEDLRSVREEGVAHVMRLFFKSLAGIEPAEIGSAPVAPEEGDAATKEMERVVQLVCDEEALDNQFSHVGHKVE
ncbi:GSCFA domain-containing protein [Lutimaribacter marinistellae]|uniref:GSCFA domain-containing protein n=1 Tax=Lutimaribacter marinistellae TaxID=1820329 RepID=A0ABV7TBS9_9RHOB